LSKKKCVKIFELSPSFVSNALWADVVSFTQKLLVSFLGALGPLLLKLKKKTT